MHESGGSDGEVDLDAILGRLRAIPQSRGGPSDQHLPPPPSLPSASRQERPGSLGQETPGSLGTAREDASASLGARGGVQEEQSWEAGAHLVPVCSLPCFAG